MDDTSTTGVYGPREIQNTSKKYMDGHINNINNSDAFKHVAEVPLFIQTLIQNVQKMASSLGLKNPKDYNKYRRETTNCCRLIQNYVAATIHGGLQTFPDTKFMVYMMANQFLDHNGKESTITIEAFTNLYLNDSSSNSASPLTNYKLPSDFEDAKLQYINNEEVMTETMFAIAEKETSDAYSETDKIEDMNAELRQYFNDFAQANSCLHTQLSNPNTIDLVGMIRHENGILLLQKLLINVSRKWRRWMKPWRFCFANETRKMDLLCLKCQPRFPFGTNSTTYPNINVKMSKKPRRESTRRIKVTKSSSSPLEPAKAWTNCAKA